jgi:hypothetical protein
VLVKGLVRCLSLVLCTVAMSACTSEQSSNPFRPGRVQTSTTLPRSGTYGLIPANPNLTDRIVLKSSRVISGHNIDGTLLVINHGTTPINLTKSCKPGYVVALTSSRYSPQVAFTTSCSSLGFVIAPGTNRLPFRAITTYLDCQQVETQTTEPKCTHNGPPPLPAGTYEAVLYGSGLALPKPRPVSVTLTRG